MIRCATALGQGVKCMEIKLTESLIKEIQRLTAKIPTAKPEDLEREFEEIRNEIDLPQMKAVGIGCGGCTSCGACPVAYIKAGYLLAAFAAS